MIVDKALGRAPDVDFSGHPPSTCANPMATRSDIPTCRVRSDGRNLRSPRNRHFIVGKRERAQP